MGRIAKTILGEVRMLIAQGVDTRRLEIADALNLIIVYGSILCNIFNSILEGFSPSNEVGHS